MGAQILGGFQATCVSQNNYGRADHMQLGRPDWNDEFKTYHVRQLVNGSLITTVQAARYSAPGARFRGNGLRPRFMF
jgi:hypothetical protein